MRISFPVINNYFTRAQDGIKRSYLKPLPSDSFEKTSFGTANVIGTSTHSFDIKNIKNLRCPVCGLIMLTDSQINDFVDDIKDKRGYDLVDALEKYEDESYITGVKTDKKTTIFRPQKQEIVNIIKDLAIQNPKKTLSELVDLEAQRCIDVLIQGQMKVVGELEQYVKSSNITRAKKESIKVLLDEYKKQIYGESATRFSRKDFIHEFSNITTDRKVQAGINEITEKLPTSQRDINSWFVKYSKSLKSADIARKLVQQSIPTAEHLVPKSLAGANSAKNYICDCSECNSNRSNLEFDLWMETIPNFKQNLQQYLQDIQSAIDSGKISRKNNTYIEDIIETIAKLSKEKIVLDLPNSTDDGKRERMLVAREAKIDKIAKHIKDQSKLKKEKEQEIERLESHPYYQNLFLLETLERNLAICKEEINSCSDNKKLVEIKERIRDLQNKIDVCRDYVANTGYVEDEIKELQNTVAIMQRTTSQLQKLKMQLDKESELRQQQNKLIHINTDKNIQNTEIIKSLGFDVSDKHDYEQYCYYTELLQTANQMIMGNNRVNKGQNKEVILIAIETIKEKIAQYLKKDSVIYFLNLKEIRERKAEIETINTQLDEIENKKSLVELYEKDLWYAGKGKTVEQLQSDLDKLLESRETIAQIHELPQYRSELKNLSEAISFNKKIYHDIKKHYETMTNEEFLYQTSLIY